MKLFHQYLIVLILGLFQIAMAVQVQKSIVVSYPDNTPDSVLNEAKKAITDAVSVISNPVSRKHILTTSLQGGWITHEFSKFFGS
jgi:hypothetical protein